MSHYGSIAAGQAFYIAESVRGWGNYYGSILGIALRAAPDGLQDGEAMKFQLADGRIVSRAARGIHQTLEAKLAAEAAAKERQEKQEIAEAPYRALEARANETLSRINTCVSIHSYAIVGYAGKPGPDPNANISLPVSVLRRILPALLALAGEGDSPFERQT